MRVPDGVVLKGLLGGSYMIDVGTGLRLNLAVEIGELRAQRPETGVVFEQRGRQVGDIGLELHLALASGTDDPSFSPEPFTTLYQRSLYQSMRNLAGRVLQLAHDDNGNRFIVFDDPETRQIVLGEPRMADAARHRGASGLRGDVLRHNRTRVSA